MALECPGDQSRHSRVSARFDDLAAYMAGRRRRGARCGAGSRACRDTMAKNASLTRDGSRDSPRSLRHAARPPMRADVGAAKSAGQGCCVRGPAHACRQRSDRGDGHRARGRSPRCPTRSAKSATCATGRRASRSGRCACRSASSASSTNLGPTSPRTPPDCVLKAGNATILRGGSEALASNRAIAACVHAKALPPADCRPRASNSMRQRQTAMPSATSSPMKNTST